MPTPDSDCFFVMYMIFCNGNRFIHYDISEKNNIAPYTIGAERGEYV